MFTEQQPSGQSIFRSAPSPQTRGNPLGLNHLDLFPHKETALPWTEYEANGVLGALGPAMLVLTEFYLFLRP